MSVNEPRNSRYFKLTLLSSLCKTVVGFRSKYMNGANTRQAIDITLIVQGKPILLDNAPPASGPITVKVTGKYLQLATEI